MAWLVLTAEPAPPSKKFTFSYREVVQESKKIALPPLPDGAHPKDVKNEAAGASGQHVELTALDLPPEVLRQVFKYVSLF